ncbi:MULTISPECIES: replication initiation protein RepC [unclassified Bartonella]|uniref:replication initiation protein RepC n=1 Tax=unclassified Bartonella TaxID=2645622 RepID=UPI0035D12645
MVKKTSGRKINAHHIEFRKLAETAEIGSVSRGQLIGLVNQLEQTDFIKESEAKLLLNLLRTAPRDSFEKGGVPIVFKSNRQLSYDIKRSESRVSFLLSCLYDCGLIVMRDSGNFKRYPIRNHSDDIVTACGIDLRILIARYHELKQKAGKALEIREKQEEALHYFRGLVRQIKTCYTEMEATPFTSLLFSRMQKILHIIGRPAKASFEKLYKAIRLFEGILQRFFGQKTSKTRYTDLAGNIHIEHTTPNYNCNCNKNGCSDNSEHTQIVNVTSGHDKMAYENIENGKTAPSLPSKSSTLPQIKPEILEKALPNAVLFSECSFQTESDLIHSMYPMYRMIKVSEHAAEQATKIMGLKKTALAIAIIFEKYARGLVKSPGGYLRGMIDKEKKGELYLERSLFALLKQADQEEINSLNLEKNQKIKLNEEKSSLFEFELNKTLNNLTMSKFA